VDERHFGAEASALHDEVAAIVPLLDGSGTLRRSSPRMDDRAGCGVPQRIAHTIHDAWAASPALVVRLGGVERLP
jgi:hypothetical protein